jgi:hypothetical protein
MRETGHAVRLCWSASSSDGEGTVAERIARIRAVITESEQKREKCKELDFSTHYSSERWLLGIERIDLKW